MPDKTIITKRIGAKVGNQRLVSVIDTAWLSWCHARRNENHFPRDFFREIPSILDRRKYQVVTVKGKKK